MSVANPSYSVEGGTEFSLDDEQSLRNLLVLLLSFVTLAALWGVVYSIDRHSGLFGSAFIVTGGCTLLLFMFGYNRFFLLGYIMLLPIFSGIDRYYGDVLYEVTGWIARTGFVQASLCGIVVVLIWSHVISENTHKKSPSWLNRAVILFFIVVTSSLLYAQPTDLLLPFFFANIPYYFLFYLAVRYSVHDLRDTALLFRTMVAVVSIVITSRYLYQGIDLASRINVNYIFGGAVNYSQVLILALPIAFVCFRTSIEKRTKLLFGVAFGQILLEILFTQTRGAYIAAAISMGYLLIRMKLFRPNWLLSLLVPLVLWIGIFMLGIRAEGDSSVYEGSNLYRLDQVTSFLSIWMSEFLFGFGFGSQYLLTFNNGSHNSFLSIAVDIGLVGVSVFVSLFVLALRRTRDLRAQFANQQNAILWLYAIEAILIGQLVHANTTGNEVLYNLPVQVLFFLFALFAVVAGISPESEKQQEQQNE